MLWDEKICILMKKIAFGPVLFYGLFRIFWYPIEKFKSPQKKWFLSYGTGGWGEWALRVTFRVFSTSLSECIKLICISVIMERTFLINNFYYFTWETKIVHSKYYLWVESWNESPVMIFMYHTVHLYSMGLFKVLLSSISF